MNNNKNKLNWQHLLKQSVNTFIDVNSRNHPFDIISILNSDNTGKKLVVLKFQGRYTKTLSIKDIIYDDDILNGLSQQTVRELTYLYAIEQLAPDFTVESIQLSDIAEDYIVTLKSRFKNANKLKQSAVNISKDNEVIKKLSSKDANKIGYMAGVKDTVDEFSLRTG